MIVKRGNETYEVNKIQLPAFLAYGWEIVTEDSLPADTPVKEEKVEEVEATKPVRRRAKR